MAEMILGCPGPRSAVPEPGRCRARAARQVEKHDPVAGRVICHNPGRAGSGLSIYLALERAPVPGPGLATARIAGKEQHTAALDLDRQGQEGRVRRRPRRWMALRPVAALPDPRVRGGSPLDGAAEQDQVLVSDVIDEAGAGRCRRRAMWMLL